MQNRKRLPTPILAKKESSSPINVVIAYENFETGQQAIRLYENLSKNLATQCSFRNQMWKFDVLGVPKLREMAANDVQNSDVVIISCRGTELSDEIKAWIEIWVSEVRIKPLALVALFDCPPIDAFMVREVRNYLESVALRGQMEFFVQPEDVGHNQAQTETYRFQRGQTDAAISALAGAVHRETGSPRWGINE